jgi:phage baseplate assembly protein gpV
MPRALRANKLRGVHLAIVVDNKDGEGNPGYRVKVKFPWMNDQETTYWSRIALPMGGPDRGTYFLPEIEDQVLVVFEHGDVDRPIVIGSLWSKKQEPVEVNASGKNNTKLIKSRSGHRIIFDDTAGAEKVVIVDKTKKNKIVLDSANKVVKIESAGDIDIKAATTFVMHSDTLKMGITGKLTGKGSSSLLTHAGSTFGLKASSKITISGSQIQINTAHSASTTVSGSGAGSLGGVAAETAKDQITEQGGGGAGGGAGAGAASSSSPSPSSSSASSSSGGASASGSASAGAASGGASGGGAGAGASGSAGAGASGSAGAGASGGAGAGASGSAGAGASGSAGAGASGSAGAGASGSAGERPSAPQSS